MYLTVIVDNLCGSSRLLGEHGLSLLIETPRGNVLFDTGQGRCLLHNLSELGFPLSGIDRICLSHGHYDHSGGLSQVLLRKPNMEIWASRFVDAPHYSMRIGSPSYIGLDVKLEHRNFMPVDDKPVEIVDGLWAFTVPQERRESLNRPGKPGLVVQRGGAWVEDPFDDDLSLMALGKNGPSLILGCAHSGVENIMKYAKETFGYDKFYSVIGGTHLSAFPKAELTPVLTRIGEQFSVNKWRPNHCTGFVAASALASLHDDVLWASSGMSLDL